MTYVPLKEPWAKQREALTLLEGREFYGLRMEMRTGKTKVILDDFGRRQDAGQVDDLLVIAPAGVYRTWETAVKDHVGEPLRSALRVHVWSAGDTTLTARRRLAAFLEYTGPRLLLVNVEALSMVKRAKELTASFVRDRRVMAVVDESTTIKNHKAKRTKFLLTEVAPLAKYRRILTGLIAPRSPLDVFAQFEFLQKGCLGFTNYWAFQHRYAVIRKQMIGGRSIDIIDGYRDEDELHARMAEHSFRVRLAECYDLPDSLYTVREVKMTEEQERIYEDLKHFATAQLEADTIRGAHVTATMVITQILRLHQVLCGHVPDEYGDIHHVPENRTKELLALLEEHTGKAVIWVSYDADIQNVTRVLREEYGPQSVSRFWGGNRSTREEEERRFQNDPECLFMVATAAAGGRGRMWAAADLVVYYSNTNNLEHRSQSEARTQAVGKAKNVLYVDLVTPGTVDEKILKALRNKIGMAAAIDGDAWRSWVI